MSCWESGGPEWLFGAMVSSGLVAFMGLMWWFDTRRSFAPRRERTSVLVPVAVVVAIVGAMAIFDGSVDVEFASVLVVVMVSTLVVAEAIRRHAVAVEDQKTLAAGWGITYKAVRWGAPVLFFGGIAVALLFFILMWVMGSECTV